MRLATGSSWLSAECADLVNINLNYPIIIFVCASCVIGARREIVNLIGNVHAKIDSVVMDVIKTEPEVDPLAVQPCDDAVKEETDPSPDEGSLLDLNIIKIKEECVDDSYNRTSEIKLEEIILPNNFSVVKCEAKSSVH
ncbi:uncharacterized protein [Periplaneta americana]|uniref:uncharacterized protein isoform X4 n=1 Tax=Periplaneta americana TaxID=6978 RepID=UPI0037E71B8C